MVRSQIEATEVEKTQAYYEKYHWKITLKRMIKDWRLYLMLLPLAIIFILWRYLPMYGLLISFKEFEQVKGVLGSSFSGLAGFERIVTDPNFWRAFRNTFMISLYGMVFGFPMPIILALLFSEVKNQVYRSVLQILSYLPKFVSTVVVTSLVKLLCSPQNVAGGYAGGLITRLLTAINMIPEGTVIFKNPQYFRAIFQITGIWEAAGYGSIVYFAAILAISPTSYEAARMDGANKMEQIKYVTFPGIASTLTIMLILEIGKLFTVGYEKVYLLYNQDIYETADIVATYVMRAGGMVDASGTTGDPLSYSVAASADLFNAVIAMLLVIGSNMISRRVSDTSLY